MTLLNLANELLLNIVDKLGSDVSINRLSRTCQRLYYLLNLYSYKTNVESKHGGSALAYGVKHGLIDTVKRAISQGAKCSITQVGYPPLISEAAKTENVPIMQLLLSQPDVDVDAHGYDGLSAIMIASRQGNVDMIRHLLAHGANINFRYQRCLYKESNTPLREAISNEHVDAVRVLLGDEDLELDHSNGMSSLLRLAATTGNLDILQMLLA